MEDKQEEINRTLQDNNCFLTSLVAEGETFLYDEAEQLLYNCSEKSFPAVLLKEEHHEWVHTSESDWETYSVKTGSQRNIFKKNSGETPFYSLSSLRKEPTRSQFIPSTVPSRSLSGPTSPEVKDENKSTDSITPFERAIIKKFKEISNTFQDNQPVIDQNLSPEETNKDEVSNMEQLYLRQSPFIVTSSAESGLKTPDSTRPIGEEVFSNSDFDEATKMPRESNIVGKDCRHASDIKYCSSDHCKIDTIVLQCQTTRKEILSPNQSLSTIGESSKNTSEAKCGSFKTGNIVSQRRITRKGSLSPDRTLRPRPLQSDPSMKAANTAVTPCLFVQEILKSKLVMKEDIFSTSQVKSDDSALSYGKDKKEEQEERPEAPARDFSPKEEKPVVRTRNAKPRSFSPWRHVPMHEGVVYETAGEKPLNKKQTECNLMFDLKEPRRATRLNLIQGQEIGQEGDDTGQAQRKVNSWLGSGRAEVQIDEEKPTIKKFVDAGVSTFTQLNDIKHLNLQDASTGTSTTKVMSKYVKLPCFPEAFGTNDYNVKELRIKDGTSFESLNALEVLSTATTILGNSAKVGKHNGNPLELLCEPRVKIKFNESLGPKILELKDSATDCQLSTKNMMKGRKTLETRDASAGPQVITMDKVTQTRELKHHLEATSTANISIQCDSRILIMNEEGTLKEIMICDDEGNGVQLYNSLGFPLTDMDGYVLKDSHGRFLVRLDSLGVPVCCTNGEGISLEDGSTWNTVKDGLNVIHQGSKKNIIKKPMDRRIKGRNRETNLSMRQISNAMRNLTHKIDLADKLSSMDTTSVSRSRSRVNLEPTENLSHLRENPLFPQNVHVIQPSPATKNVVKNSSTLVAEMKSIARLRNALLEKVNFIAVHRKTPGIVPRNGTRSLNSTEVSPARKNAGDVQWQSEPKILKKPTNEPECKLGSSFNTATSPDDRDKPYTWKNPVKLTPSTKPPRIENIDNLEMTLQDDTRLGEPSTIDRFFEKELSPTWQLAKRRARVPQRRDRPPQRSDRTPERRDRTPQRDVSRHDFQSSQLKRMEDMLMKWHDSRPMIDSESSSSFLRT